MQESQLHVGNKLECSSELLKTRMKVMSKNISSYSLQDSYVVKELEIILLFVCQLLKVLKHDCIRVVFALICINNQM